MPLRKPKRDHSIEVGIPVLDVGDGRYFSFEMNC